MRFVKRLFPILAVALLATATSMNVGAAEKYKTEKQRLSYAIGTQVGRSLKQQGFTDIDPSAMSQAIADVLSGSELKVSQKDMQEAVMNFQVKKAAEKKAEAKVNKEAGEKFLAKNKKKKGVKVTKDGIQYEVIKEGKGEKPKATDTVTVNYAGSLINGKEFDSSYKRGKPASFQVNGVIKGWTEILQMMPVGSKWHVVIPSDLAYGEHGAGGVIGPDETLIFDIELLSIKK